MSKIIAELEDEVAALEAKVAEFRGLAFVCIEMQRAGLSTKYAIEELEKFLEGNTDGSNNAG